MSNARLIYVAGLDGSGKTSQSERFVSGMTSTEPRWVYRWVRWEPFLTRPLMSAARWILGRGSGRGTARPSDETGYGEFTAGKQKIFRRTWLRRIWTCTVLLEFLIQAWWRLAVPIRKGRWILVDRYLPDLWVDLAMNFGEGPQGVARISRHPLCRLFPRVERLIYLDVDPEVGYDRKRDGTPLSYLRDRAPLYEALGAILDFDSIDANRSFDEVALELQTLLAVAESPEL